MKKLLLLNLILIFLFCSFSIIFAQNLLLSGQVVDVRTGNPLQGAEVYLSKSECGTTTDPDGLFSLVCPDTSRQHTLIIQYLGYQKFFVQVDKFKNRSQIKLKPTSFKGDEVVVSADKIDILKYDIPQAKTVVDFKEIQRYGSNEISDILKPISAIRIEGNDLDGRRIQIRGSDPDEVNVYIDGILINNVRFDNAADLSIIPVESIESLEVLKGSNSALMGNGAFGGIINITTRQKSEMSFFLKGKYGSFDSKYVVGNLNLPITKKFAVSYFGQANTMAPNIEFFPSEQYSDKTENNEIETKKSNHNVTVNYYPGSGQLSTKFIGYFFDYNKPRWRSKYNNYLSAMSYKGSILGVKDIDMTVNHLHSRDEFERTPTGNALYRTNYKTNRLNARFGKKVDHKAGEIQFVAEYYHDDLKTTSQVEDLNWTNRLYDAYLYDNRFSTAAVISFDDYVKDLPILTWKTYLGLRSDFLANGDNDVTHMAGVQVDYNLEPWKFSPYFNYGKNVKYPTLQENAFIRDLTDVTRTDTTQKRLKPEYNTALEAGLTATYNPENSFYQSMEASLALFSRTVYNRLITRPFDDIVANVQMGRSVTRGIETSVKFNRIFTNFNLTASFTQLDVTNPFLYAFKPKKNMSMHLSYVTRFGLYITGTYFYEGKSIAWYYDLDNELQTENITPFNDADFSMGYKIPVTKYSEVELQLSGYNIFDNSGFKYYYLKKRYLQVSLAIRY